MSTPLPMRIRSPVANTSSSTASAVRSCRWALLSTRVNRTGPLSVVEVDIVLCDRLSHVFS